MNGNTPNAERTNAVVQALHVLGRVDGKYCTTKCKECPAKQFSTEHPGGCCEYGTMKAAADLIESITTQLAESQRREKAAVEDLGIIKACEVCKRDDDGTCGDYEGCNFLWRGVAEGEKVDETAQA